MGWYAMALVDTLEFFPKDHPRRAELIAILNREAEAIAKYQDPRSDVWWDIVDLGGREKNYHESSASAMFVYALARGVREGFLPERYMKTAVRGWEGIKKEFIKPNADGTTDWEGTVSVSGLGGNPYRDRLPARLHRTGRTGRIDTGRCGPQSPLPPSTVVRASRSRARERRE